MNLFKKQDTGTDTVLSCHVTFDDPWYEAKIVVKCPDNISISHVLITKNENEIPSKGDEVPLVFGEFTWEVNA